jgi:predicted lipid-binding transport protein (Tim44 family)
MKKLLLLTFVFMFAFQSMSFAAIGGSKGVSAPKSSPHTTQSAPSTSPTSPNKTSDYKPSAPANSYSDKAPATAAKTQQTQQSTGSSFLRNAGLFGGGMLLGSMLGGMFGLGSSGIFSEIIGMFFNVMIIGLIFMAGRYAWNRFQESRKKKDNIRRLH